MEETLFPPTPNWASPNTLSVREDGSVAYGSKNHIIILKIQENLKPKMLMIHCAHVQKVTAVAFSPSHCSESIQNTVVSCSEDGFVKLWKIDSQELTIGHKSHWEQNVETGKVLSLNWSIANPHYIVSIAENNSLVLWDTLSNITTKFSAQVVGATQVSCCPYNEKIVAVGGKTGHIFIINLIGKGHVVYKFRGHDNKINFLSWCPIPYNVFKPDEICEEFLLASICQNKEVFVWRAGSDGKCEVKFQMPTTPLNAQVFVPFGKLRNSVNFLALSWLEPYKIYLTSNFGELIYFDIKLYLSNNLTSGAGEKSKKNLLNFLTLGHNFHTKQLFAIAGSPVKAKVVIYKTIHSNLKYPMESNKTVIEKLENEKDKPLAWEVLLPETSSLFWIAGYNRKLIAFEIKSSKIEISFSYNTVSGILFCAVVSPHDPNKLAIGAGDGIIRLWNLTETCGDIKVYWEKIKDKVVCLDWHPIKDGILAYGTSGGRVGLVDTKSNKLPNVFKPSDPQAIYSLTWGPQFPSELAKDSEFDIYFIQGEVLYLHCSDKLNSDPLNLSKIISFPCQHQTNIRWKPDYSLIAVGNKDGSICLLEPFQFKIIHTVLAYKKKVYSIAWHPSSTSTDLDLSIYHGYFTSGSSDKNNEIRVFNCRKEENKVNVEQVAILKGHPSKVQSVSWCPHISGRLVSSCYDNSVQIWDVITQALLVNFSPGGLPMFSIWSPTDPDFMITGCNNDTLCVWKISAQENVSPTPCVKTKQNKTAQKKITQSVILKDLTGEEAETTKNEGKPKEKEGRTLSLAEMKQSSDLPQEPTMFSKVWKRNDKTELKACYCILRGEEEEDDKRDSLPFFFDEAKFYAAIKAEGFRTLEGKMEPLEDRFLVRPCVASGTRRGIQLKFRSSENSFKRENILTEMALWNGTIKDVIEEKMKSGELNEFLVSLSPAVSPRVWQEACLSYSKTLTEKKYHRKAASYLLVCNKIYEAVNLLIEANLFMEAFFIAKSRLPDTDPTLKKIIRRYAEWLERKGAFLKACRCYLHLEEYQEIAKIGSQTKDPEYLNLAALAAKKCNAFDLEILEATNAVFKCLETGNTTLAQQIFQDHPDLKVRENFILHLGLIILVYETLRSLTEGELKLNTDILSHIKNLYNIENIVFPNSLPAVFNKHFIYKNWDQVLPIVVQEICFAACADNFKEISTHLIKALSTCYRYNKNNTKNIHFSYKLCHFLSPEGFLSPNSIFTTKGDRWNSLVKSLRAFLCASIVRYFSNNNEPGVLKKYVDVLKDLNDDNLNTDKLENCNNNEYAELMNSLDVLKEFKDDILDEDSCKYFKTLVEVDICKTELLEIKKKFARKTLVVGNSEDHLEKNTFDSKLKNDNEIKKDNALEETLKLEKEFKCEVESEQNINLKKSNENGCGDFENNLVSHQPENGGTDQFYAVTETHEEERLMKKCLDSLERLNAEIEKFERERISSPHPLPVYSMLKDLCKRFPENESANFLLQDLEEKFLRLN